MCFIAGLVAEYCEMFHLLLRGFKSTLSKNDTDVAHYNFNTQLILVIFGRDIGDRVCFQMVICYPTSPN